MAVARELPTLPLDFALALVHLYAEKCDRRYERAAARYLERYMAEAAPSLEDVAGVAALLAERKTRLDLTGGRWRMLFCEECGCASAKLGKGWVAYACDDPDGVEEPCIVVYCPPCAAAAGFGYGPEAAESYVCAWYPALLETRIPGGDASPLALAPTAGHGEGK